jgi:hypothetical protein
MYKLFPSTFIPSIENFILDMQSNILYSDEIESLEVFSCKANI